MAGRREMLARDRKRNSISRKRTARERAQRQQQQSAVVQKLLERAREEARQSG